jgi:phospholipid/cholesterol/gamma-HCH transport system substrate-binding protein
MTVARVAALAALVIAVVVVAVLLLSDDGGKEYKVQLINAGQLVNGDDVQIGGRRVGSIEDISLTDHNLAQLKIKVDSDFAPLHKGTTAVVRATSLSGVANRYLALSPGANNAPKLADGATLPTDTTTSIVDLDEIFNTLNKPTREGLQNVIQGSATQYDHKGPQANRAAEFFNPALSTTSALINEVLSDQRTFTSFVVDASDLVSNVAERRGDLSALVGNTNATAGAIAAENQALAQAIGLLPATLRKGDTTFVNLRATLGDLDQLVNASKPVAPKLAPFFKTLRPLLSEARPTVRDLSALIRTAGPDNDLIDILHKTPSLAQQFGVTSDLTIKALQKSQPVVTYIRPFAPELIGWIRDFGQGASAYDANGHYARIQPIFNAFSVTENPAGGGQVLAPNAPSQRGNFTQTHQLRRCPGAASQPPEDKSAPFTDDGRLLPDCDPNQVPPGP